MNNKKQQKHFDEIRPDGICYYNSIQAHKKFCESLGNKPADQNYENAFKNIMQNSTYTTERTEEQR